MQVTTYINNALKAKKYKEKNWVVRVFSRTKYSEESKRPGKIRTEPYDILYNEEGYKFFTGEGWEPIEGVPAEGPIANLKDTFELTRDICLNTESSVVTTYGRALFNLIILVENFGNKIPYINNRTSIPYIEDIIAGRLEDTPKPGEPRDHSKIYVDEYINFGNSLIYISGLTQLCVWAETPKLMVAPPGIKEYKQGLLDEHKDQLNDPAIIAQIEQKLVEFDAEYLKNDPGGKYFADNKKMRAVVRKKLFLMYGMETDGAGGDPIINSLSEGWDINNFPQMNDALRLGSYSRGFETQLGGELFKWLLRASSSIQIQPTDCGTKLGFHTPIDTSNFKNYIGLYYFEGEESVRIVNEDQAKSLIGRDLYIRSPMYCKQKGTDYCKYCVGERLALNPTAISSSIADFGSVILVQSLANFHGKALATTPFNFSLLS
jgi:hypothetical protein